MELYELLEPYRPAIWKGLAFYGLTLLAILADLWSGLRKAHLRGEISTSYGFRQTVSKIAGYFNVLIISSIIDTVLIISNVHEFINIPMIPYVTAIFTIGFCLIEGKSIFEKDHQKAKYMQTAKLAREVVGNLDWNEVANAISKYLKEDIEPKTDNEND